MGADGQIALGASWPKNGHFRRLPRRHFRPAIAPSSISDRAAGAQLPPEWSRGEQVVCLCRLLPSAGASLGRVRESLGRSVDD